MPPDINSPNRYFHFTITVNSSSISSGGGGGGGGVRRAQKFVQM
jgi:hypothetical protein